MCHFIMEIISRPFKHCHEKRHLMIGQPCKHRSKGVEAVYMLKNHDENTKTSFENSVVNFKYEFNKKKWKRCKSP